MSVFVLKNQKTFLTYLLYFLLIYGIKLDIQLWNNRKDIGKIYKWASKKYIDWCTYIEKIKGNLAENIKIEPKGFDEIN